MTERCGKCGRSSTQFCCGHPMVGVSGKLGFSPDPPPICARCKDVWTHWACDELAKLRAQLKLNTDPPPACDQHGSYLPPLTVFGTCAYCEQIARVAKLLDSRAACDGCGHPTSFDACSDCRKTLCQDCGPCECESIRIRLTAALESRDVAETEVKRLRLCQALDNDGLIREMDRTDEARAIAMRVAERLMLCALHGAISQVNEVDAATIAKWSAPPAVAITIAEPDEPRRVWALVRSALNTTDCKPKNVHTAREALDRVRDVLCVVNSFLRAINKPHEKRPADE